MAYGFKTGGRRKGTLNKSTQQGRENLQIILADEVESGRIQEALHQLSPKDYIAAVLKMVSFALPKPQPADCIAEPHAAYEQLAHESTLVKNEKKPKEPADNKEMPDPTEEQIERFRITTGWTHEQLNRYMLGEPFLSVHSKP